MRDFLKVRRKEICPRCGVEAAHRRGARAWTPTSARTASPPPAPGFVDWTRTGTLTAGTLDSARGAPDNGGFGGFRRNQERG